MQIYSEVPTPAAPSLESLVQKHRDLSQQVDQLDQLRTLTTREEVELRRLKKVKLQTKDQIAVLRSKLDL